jgi:hypothetical protein
MKDSLVKSLINLIQKSKGKKPIVIILSIAVIVLGYFAVQKGYISQDLLDSGILTDQVDSLFVDSPIDTLTNIDTLVVNDTNSIK